jgi:hypothetical protein
MLTRTVLVAGVLALAAACTGKATPETSVPSPLAVINDASTDISLVRGGAGRLSYEGSCVSLVSARATITLAWRNAQVAWDPALPGVLFTSEGQRLVLQQGDQVEVAGDFVVGDNGDIAAVEWLATPAPTCQGPVFIVHAVRRLTAESSPFWHR